MIIISLFFRLITKNKGQQKNARPAGVARKDEGAEKENRRPKDPWGSRRKKNRAERRSEKRQQAHDLWRSHGQIKRCWFSTRPMEPIWKKNKATDKKTLLQRRAQAQHRQWPTARMILFWKGTTECAAKGPKLKDADTAHSPWGLIPPRERRAVFIC